MEKMKKNKAKTSGKIMQDPIRQKRAPQAGLLILLVFILALAAQEPFCLQGAAAEQPGAAPPPRDGSARYLKIGLRYAEGPLDSYKLTAREGFTLKQSPEAASGADLSAHQTLQVKREGEQIRVLDAAGNEVSADENGLTVPAGTVLQKGGILTGNGNPALIALDGKSYRGGLSFVPDKNGALQPVNLIKTEEYLYGVVNSEMNFKNPAEALKAQAVVARSYALANPGRHRASGYDLCDSTHCQVYKGYGGENAATNRAADETAGFGLYYKGEPVAGFFYKNSAGHTQNAEDVWNDSVGYLRGVKDEYSPTYTWKASFAFSELESKLQTAGHDIGTLRSVAVTKRNAAGAVDTVTFTGSKGEAAVSKEKVRRLLGMTAVKSSVFSLGSGQASAGGPTIRLTTFYVRDGSGKQTAFDGHFALGADGTARKLILNDSYLIHEKGIEKIGADLSSGGSRGTAPGQGRTPFEDLPQTGNTLIINGYGSGHGVGMPQDSAIEMAKRGHTFDQILRYFYTDIEVR